MPLPSVSPAKLMVLAVVWLTMMGLLIGPVKVITGYSGKSPALTTLMDSGICVSLMVLLSAKRVASVNKLTLKMAAFWIALGHCTAVPPDGAEPHVPAVPMVR